MLLLVISAAMALLSVTVLLLGDRSTGRPVDRSGADAADATRLT
jgi:hypothetical protein